VSWARGCCSDTLYFLAAFLFFEPLTRVTNYRLWIHSNESNTERSLMNQLKAMYLFSGVEGLKPAYNVSCALSNLEPRGVINISLPSAKSAVLF
jgi:hypothetical protein